MTVNEKGYLLGLVGQLKHQLNDVEMDTEKEGIAKKGLESALELFENVLMKGDFE